MTEQVVLEADDGHDIHALMFAPDQPLRGAIQVFHGLGEHAARYARFAAAANSRGLALCVHDHRGHGGHAEMQGYLADTNGWERLVSDGLVVYDALSKRFAEVPVVLLGHSMGSFVAQRFAMYHGDRLDALILSASTWPSRIEMFAGKLAAHFECWRVGPQRESKLLDRQGFSRFNKRFEPGRTGLDWLSRDEAEVDKYVADPLCGGPYTAGLWRDLTGGLLAMHSDTELMRVPSDLPILITGGEHDPVGGADGMGHLALHYAQTGHSRLKVKVYPEGRHEMLNEINCDEVMRDWLDWIELNPQTKKPRSKSGA